MAKKIVFLFFSFFYFPFVFASLTDSYLVEIGKTYFNRNEFQSAKVEFERALQINPQNREAEVYLTRLRRKEIERTLDQISRQKIAPERPSLEKPPSPLDPDPVSLKPVPPRFEPSFKEDVASLAPEESFFYLEGDYQLSLGVESGDLIWKRAEADLNEANWRLLSDSIYNRQQNTFDPAIFSQLRLKTGHKSSDTGFGFHSYLDVSPWSFIGESERFDWEGESISVNYWSSTRHTLSQVVYLDGNSRIIDGRKVRDGKITVDGQEIKIKRDFWPLREFWFDFGGDNLSLRVFPAALQDQAYVSDNPLGFTNRHMWWAPSPWLTQWESGHFNLTDEDLFKGYWDDSLAYLTRTSAGERITNLRGFSLSFNQAGTSVDFTAASPKNLWQDYDDFDTLNSALRAKYLPGENLILGLTHASKHGFDSGLDAFNHVLGLDSSYGVTPQTSLSFEIASSRSEYDRKADYRSQNYRRKKRGNTYHFNLIHSSEEAFGKDFYRIRPEEEDDSFYRLKLSFTRMDENFDAALADYHHTRDDSYWARHLTFRKPFSYQYFGLHGPDLGWDDLYPFRIGDGIDSGRYVAGLRWEAENLVNQNLNLLFDLRDVRGTSGGLIENVSRLEGVYNLTPCLRLKGLGIYHYLPKTEEGIDPFMQAHHPRSDIHYRNPSVEEGKDPSLKTFSAGIEYDFFDWLSANFIWERSNDTTLAYDNFPRALFADTWDWPQRYMEDGRFYRHEVASLYATDFFPTPPYPYYNIFKAGLFLEPLDNLELYLTYTYNEYNWAQIIDENMNHLGLEASYIMDDKVGFYLRYVYSRVNNLSDFNHGDGIVNKTGHHNVFSEIKYFLNQKSELIFQYGAGGYGFISTPTDTPFGGGVAALDTQHIVRVYYRRKF